MRLFPLACTLLLSTPAFAQTSTEPAAAVPMMAPTGWLGQTGHFLGAITQPVLGQPFVMNLNADPQAGFAFVMAGWQANSGIHPLPGDPLSLYLDPTLLLGTIPTPLGGGNAQIPLPLPPDPTLTGVDLAFQAIVASPTELGATNLLAVHLGMFAGPGNFAFAWQFQAGLQPQQYWRTQGGIPKQVHCNNSGGSCQITIQGVRNGTGGRLEIRNSATPGVNGGSSVKAFVPASQTQFSVTVTLGNGQCLYFYNRDDAPAGGGPVQSGQIDVQYSITVSCR